MLKWLNLMYNNVTEAGKKNVLKALYDPTSMDSIIESNHICIPYTYDTGNLMLAAQRPLIESEVFLINNWDISIKQKIRQKVILALCGVDGSLFDLSHFNELPLQLMPRVLELIQKHTEISTKRYNEDQLQKDALSRLFHTLRGWELPLLFENLGSSFAKRATRKSKRRKTRR